MSTVLNRTSTHGNLPFVGGKGDDTFTFDIAISEEYTDARLDILGGRYNAGARIAEQPAAGETGSGRTIKVHWWFDGGADPTKPPFVTYRIRAFTKATEKHAMLVAIENTGHIPFDLGLSGDALRAAEAFVDWGADWGEVQNAHMLFDNYFDPVVILADEECTKERIRDKLAELSATYAAELTLIGHGGLSPAGSENCILILHDGISGWPTNPKNLTEADVRGWKTRPQFQNAKLGLVYMMNCYGSKFSDAWLHLGFKASIGSVGINSMPEPMFTFFWTRYRNGEPASVAAQEAWEDSRNLWQALYPPDCRLVRLPQPPFLSVSCTDNKLISDSRSLVSGNQGLRVTDDL